MLFGLACAVFVAKRDFSMFALLFACLNGIQGKEKKRAPLSNQRKSEARFYH
jgi:hypothetical protein